MTPFRKIAALSALSLLLGFSAAQSQVQFGDAVAAGNGCPAGTVSVTPAPDQSAVSILFDSFTTNASAQIQVGRSSCIVKVPVSLPAGKQLVVVQVDYRGFFVVPSGAKARIDSLLSFNKQQPLTFTRTFDLGNSNYTLTHELPLSVQAVSQCGGSDVLSIDASVTAQTNQKGEQAQIGIDSIDASSGIQYHLLQRPCAPGAQPGSSLRLKSYNIEQSVAANTSIDLLKSFTFDSAEKSALIDSILVEVSSGGGNVAVYATQPLGGNGFFPIQFNQNVTAGTTKMNFPAGRTVSSLTSLRLVLNGGMQVDAIHLLLKMNLNAPVPGNPGGGFPQPPPPPIANHQTLELAVNLTTGKSVDLFQSLSLGSFAGFKIKSVRVIGRSPISMSPSSAFLVINKSSNLSQNGTGNAGELNFLFEPPNWNDLVLGSKVTALDIKSGMNMLVKKIVLELVK